MWLCATGVALTLFLNTPDIITHLFRHTERYYRKAGTIELLELLVVTLLYASAFFYARGLKLREQPLLRLVFLLLVVVAAVELMSRRLVDNVLLAPEVTPNADLTPAEFSAIVGMLVLGFDHFLACLFMPWSLRESSRPAAVFFAMFAASVFLDRFRGRLHIEATLTIPGLAALLLPGLALCWWRYSRFQNFFRLRVESSRYHQLQGELASARRLHDAALPEQITDGPIRLHYVYEPMRQIGGDLLFVHRAPDCPDLLNAIVLDVTGHGIPAALTVNRLIGELERLFAEHPDAASEFILTALNRYISLTLSRHNIYATALCLRLNADTGLLEWSNAGHPPAFLHRFDGKAETLDSCATLLGVLDPDDFPTPAPHSTNLNRGDVLVAYTDGFSEAANPEDKQLGTDGVKNMIAATCESRRPPADWPQTLLDATLAYRQSPVEDDTLILTLYRP
jgi:serine phosphatase RsbU (regulator of sigma subunit)